MTVEEKEKKKEKGCFLTHCDGKHSVTFTFLRLVPL
jgi:hypothetical protein